MDSSVAALQATVNRFAAVGGFPRVGVDGLWGQQTQQGTYKALAFVGQGKCYQTACPDADTSKAAAGVMAQWDEKPSAAKGIAEFLARVADDLGMPHVAAPVVTPPGPIVQVPAYKPSILERFKALVLWQQITIGVAAGLGLIWFANRVSRRKQFAKKRTKKN
jgi:hypothetical protein